MGISQSLNISPQDWILDLNPDAVTLILSEAEMASATMEAAGDDRLTIALITLAADAHVAPEMVANSKIVVMEVVPELAGSIERFTKIRQQFPSLPLVAAVRDANVSLMRMLLKHGVKDVITLPLKIAELIEVLQEVAANLKRDVGVQVKQGQLITVLKSIGGVGATTIVTHLASQLAELESAKGACLIDFDVQFGNAGSYLGLSNDLSVGDLLAAGSRMDADLIRSVVSKTPNGLAVIPAPANILPFEAIDADQVMRIVELARAEYDYVILDLPSNWTNWTLSLIGQASTAFLVIELSVASLRQAKRQLLLLKEQGLVNSNFHVVANRVEKKLFRSIDLDAASQALGQPVELSMHNDFPLVRAAHDQGVLIQEIRAKSKILHDVETMLERINAHHGE